MMDIDFQSDVLVQKIKHLMITANGRTVKKAGIEEFYQAFCQVLREEIMINWTASLDTAEEKKVRHLYFLSMEYLPGRFLRQNILNIGAQEVVAAVLKKMEKSAVNILEQSPSGEDSISNIPIVNHPVIHDQLPHVKEAINNLFYIFTFKISNYVK